jgi:hypothetical protein
MFVDNEVIKKFDGEDKYDKLALASTLYDISFKGAECSALELQGMASCDSCTFKSLCERIDEVVQEFMEKTTIVKESFTFRG